MARRSLRQSLASNSTPSKRPSAEDHSSSTAKRSKRHSITQNSKSSPTKSKYFEPDTDEEELGGSGNSVGESGSGYEEGDGAASAASSHASAATDEELATSEEEKPQKKRQARSNKGKAVNASNAPSSSKKELWRPGVKAGLGPGTQVVIKKPKARDAGNTPYEDDTIHPNTMLFLKDLKENNDRQWLKSGLHLPLCRATTCGV